MHVVVQHTHSMPATESQKKTLSGTGLTPVVGLACNVVG